MRLTCPCGRDMTGWVGAYGASLNCCSPECTRAFEQLRKDSPESADRVAAQCGGYRQPPTGPTGQTGATGPTGHVGTTGGKGTSFSRSEIVSMLRAAAPFRSDGVLERQIEKLQAEGGVPVSDAKFIADRLDGSACPRCDMFVLHDSNRPYTQWHLPARIYTGEHIVPNTHPTEWCDGWKSVPADRSRSWIVRLAQWLVSP